MPSDEIKFLFSLARETLFFTSAVLSRYANVTVNLNAYAASETNDFVPVEYNELARTAFRRR